MICRQPNPQSLLQPNADSRQPNPQSLFRTVYLIDGDISNELPTAESSILSPADSRQPTADSRQPTAESSIQPNPQSLLRTDYLRLPIAERRQPTAESSIPSPNRLLTVIFSMNYRQPTADSRQPTADSQQPTADSRKPNPQSLLQTDY